MRTRERQGTNRKLRQQLREVIQRQVIAVGVDTPLSDAARSMRALNVTRLPVCDGLKLVGLITARDLTMRATAEGLDPQTSTVREVMSRYRRHATLQSFPITRCEPSATARRNCYFRDLNRR
jgi:CBS domain-containing protein